VNQSRPVGLRERKRAATRQRIATEAARLATERGVAGVTADEIADAADISRATFFRFFATKETAIAEGFSGPKVVELLDVLAAQPADLAPLDAVAQTFADLGQLLDAETRDLVLEQARIAADSPALQAWMASAWQRDEVLVAAVLADRLGVDPLDDLRPRMVAALAMAAMRLGLERWVAADGQGQPAALFREAMAAVTDRSVTPLRLLIDQ
jgi:AcrR family transcriptional regulator